MKSLNIAPYWIFPPRNDSWNEGPVLCFFPSLVEAGAWQMWDKSTFSFLWSQKCQLKTNLQNLVPAEGCRLGWICQGTYNTPLDCTWAQGFPVTDWNGISKIPWLLWFSQPHFLNPFGYTCLVLSELPNLSKWAENCIPNEFCSRRRTYQAVVQGPSLLLQQRGKEGHLSKNKIIEYLGAAIFVIYCFKASVLLVLFKDLGEGKHQYYLQKWF